jgi:signal transduction histidine kinase
VLTVAFVLILPWRAVRLAEVGAFIPTVDSLMFVADLITATLLYAQASVFRSRALTVLASGYLFAALLLVSHALTFPGAFAPDGLLGAGINTAAWVAIVQRGAFPVAIIGYVLLKQSRPDPHLEPGIAAFASAAIVLAFGVTLLATAGHDWLPSFYVNRADQHYFNALTYQLVSFAVILTATIMLLRTRASVLDVWLLVALAGWMIQSLLIMTLHSRFTIGFYGLFAMLVASHLVVMLALVGEFYRLYARLAKATVARDRERDARLMSMDAMTAVISQEVGQPLTGVNLHARAALGWLQRSPPGVEGAVKSLDATIAAGRRTMDVVKGIRAMFDKRSTEATRFSLNDLVRETASFLERELAGDEVKLELTLDESLPVILADRAQIQRVLVNLFTNAIESLRATQEGVRRIAIRSSPSEGQAVLLEFSDTGPGIAPEEMPRIFEAFFTTKQAASGLGLSLCRAIVEDHGGRLWASTGARRGATFHLELRTAA